MTRQDALHWNGRGRPEVYKLVYQIHILYTSAWVSLLLLYFYPFMFRERSLAVAVVFVVSSLLPYIFLLMTLRKSAANLTMVCSIGVHRRPQIIAQVLREEKTDRVIRSLVLMNKLQYMATSSTGFTKAPKPTKLSLSQQVELLHAKKCFDAMNKSGNGQIEVSELSTLMERLGSPITDDSFREIVKQLDINHDGVITREEFSSFYHHNVLLHDDENKHVHKSLKELAHQIFSQFDKDDTQSLTLSEFKSILESFHVDFSIDEMGELVNELDHDNTGSIGVHEFEDLLENHRYLFQTFRLPPLSFEL